MSKLTVANQAPLTAQTIETVLLKGDLSQLNPQERLNYYNKVCESVGLNPLTQPFAYIELNRKLVLYAKRDAADQLRKIHNVTIEIVSREKIGDVYVVTARASTPDGRRDESTGAVSLGTLKGDALANLFMKAETKAKRRVTLSICGLGFLDETEVETISSKEPEIVRSQTSESSDAASVSSEYVIDFGKKYIGKRLREVPLQELQNFRLWLEAEAAKGKPLGVKAERFIEELDKYTLNQEDEEFPFEK